MWLESIDGSEINMHYGKEPVLYLYLLFLHFGRCCTLWSPSTVTLSSAVHVYLIILSPPSGT